MGQKDLYNDNPDFTGFSDTLKKAMEEEFGEDYTFVIRQQLKNNSTHRTGLSITKEGCPVSPTIYLEDFYRRYLDKGDMTAVTAEFAECCRKAFSEKLDTRFFDDDPEKVKASVIFKLVNRRKNSELLKNAPHRDFLDLAVLYYRYVKIGEDSAGGILITRKIAENMGLSEEELYSLAIKNTPGMFPLVSQPITEMLARLSGIPVEALPEEMRSPDDLPLLVISNRKYIDGAGCILYPEFGKVIGEVFGNEVYILPSSIHELIVLPADKPADELFKMVHEVNMTQVPAEDYLSDNVYRYNVATGVHEVLLNPAEVA